MCATLSISPFLSKGKSAGRRTQVNRQVNPGKCFPSWTQSLPSPGAGSLPLWSRRVAEALLSIPNRQTPPPNPTPRHYLTVASLPAKAGHRQQSSTPPVTPGLGLISVTNGQPAHSCLGGATQPLEQHPVAAAQAQLPSPARMPSRGCNGAIRILTSWMDSGVKSEQH